jgi:hypothetical protein
VQKRDSASGDASRDAAPWSRASFQVEGIPHLADGRDGASVKN